MQSEGLNKNFIFIFLILIVGALFFLLNFDEAEGCLWKCPTYECCTMLGCNCQGLDYCSGNSACYRDCHCGWADPCWNISPSKFYCYNWGTSCTYCPDNTTSGCTDSFDGYYYDDGGYKYEGTLYKTKWTIHQKCEGAGSCVDDWDTYTTESCGSSDCDPWEACRRRYTGLCFSGYCILWYGYEVDNSCSNLCTPNNCSQTYNDDCSGKKLVDYNNNSVKDSVTVTGSCSNTCSGGSCTNCTPSCPAPAATTHCVKNVCGAECSDGESGASCENCGTRTCQSDCTYPCLNDKKANGTNCGGGGECCSNNCAVDYDGSGAWCAPAGKCAHSDTATCDATCYGYPVGDIKDSKWLCASHSPTGAWKVCSSANDQPGEPDHQFKEYYCCKAEGVFQWQSTECSYSEQSSLGGLFKFILSLWQKLLGMLR